MSNFDPHKHNYQSEAWQPQRIGNVQPLTAGQASVEERVAFIRKVYGLFFAGILFAVGGVLIGLAYPPLMMAAIQHPFIIFIVMIG